MSIGEAVPAQEQILAYTRPEIELVLATCLRPSQTETVLSALDLFTRRRALAGYEAERADDFVNLLLIYDRVDADGASALNIEGWHEKLAKQSETVLRYSANRDKKEIGQSEAIAREFAATLHVYLSKQLRYGLNPDLLERAGYSVEEVLDAIRYELTRVAVSQGQEDGDDLRAEVKRLYPTVTSIKLELLTSLWPILITPPAEQLRASLMKDGHRLPEPQRSSSTQDPDYL